MSRLRLEAIRWTFAVLSLGCIVAGWVFEPRRGVALALFFLFLVLGGLAAMLTLHLHPPKWLSYLERPKR
jgi:hypothetical protein